MRGGEGFAHARGIALYNGVVISHVGQFVLILGGINTPFLSQEIMATQVWFNHINGLYTIDHDMDDILAHYFVANGTGRVRLCHQCYTKTNDEVHWCIDGVV